MICTLEDRKTMRYELIEGLYRMMDESGLQDDVYIDLNEDDGRETTGKKRNDLLQSSRAEFSVFIDDDDWVSSDYIERIVGTIRRNPGIDVIGFFGEVTFSCGTKRVMMHSLMCPQWTEDMSVYYRPPNHLNPVRTELAQRVQFKDITISEDHHWSVELSRQRILKNEVFLGGAPTYFYRCREPLKGL